MIAYAFDWLSTAVHALGWLAASAIVGAFTLWLWPLPLVVAMEAWERWLNASPGSKRERERR